MINWQLFPKSNSLPEHLHKVVEVFRDAEPKITSASKKLTSDNVLSKVADGLESCGFKVERSKRAPDKIRVPVLFGRNGKLEKAFDADGFNAGTRTVIEVEAGRGVLNNQFLKDLFQACMMHDVDNLVIAVRNTYQKVEDFEVVTTFFETLYASGRLQLPLRNILVIGY
ncbi:MAG: hypothetical protein KDB88_05095 [Flavobacteriales bacterium]|nr:hypothetical protein [Flavobacteriales bacterium]